jgi:hypothetical protein
MVVEQRARPMDEDATARVETPAAGAPTFSYSDTR